MDSRYVEDNGYIKVADDAKAYEQSDAEGKVVVAGSSSVNTGYGKN